MNYEEKYNQALKRAKEFMTNKGVAPNADAFKTAKELTETIFPELRDSEDERIRKEIISFMTDSLNWFPKKETKESWISWLEKQGERKTEIEYIYPKFRISDVIVPIKPNGFYRPVRVLSIEKKTKSYYCESDDKKSFSSIPIRCEDEYKLYEQKPVWSEEDERIYQSILDDTVQENQLDSNQLDWLESLKDRVQPQPKQEWSEYDKIQLSEAIQMIEANGTWIRSEDAVKKVSNWLKSLKPQKRWKPSEEQLNALKQCIGGYYSEEADKKLESLYDDLKKL